MPNPISTHSNTSSINTNTDGSKTPPPPPQPSTTSTGASMATYGKVDASNATKQLWLAKLPPQLASLWENAQEGTHLGTLTFTKGTPRPKNNSSSTVTSSKQQPVIEQKLSLAVSPQLLQQQNETTANTNNTSDNNTTNNSKYKDLPLDYTLTNLTTKLPTLYPFTRHPNGTITLHGTVSRSCNLQMERTERYREMCKSRLLQTVTGQYKRYVKPVSTFELPSQHSASSTATSGGVSNSSSKVTTTTSLSEHSFGNSIAKCKSLIEEQQLQHQYQMLLSKKRKFHALNHTSSTASTTNDSKQPQPQSIKSILFQCFSEQRYWAWKDLRVLCGVTGTIGEDGSAITTATGGGTSSITGRSEKEVRAELTQIAEFKRSGEHKGFYELREEFATAVHGSGGVGGLGDHHHVNVVKKVKGKDDDDSGNDEDDE